MANKDYYNLLGVDKNASEADIKKAFRKLSLEYHPDRQQGKSDEEKKAAEEKFKEIAEAYAVLSDPEKKQQYDTYGTVDGMGGGVDISDIMREFFNSTSRFTGFGDMFGGFSSKAQVNRGRSIQVNVVVSMAEMFNGGDKRITYKRYKPCKDCNGTGLGKNGHVAICKHCGGTGYITHTKTNGMMMFQQTTPCPHCGGIGKEVVNPCTKCNGSGIVLEEETVTVQIPAGCVNGAYIIEEGMGCYPERMDGLAGDLKVVFKLDEEDKFHFDTDPSNIITIIDVPILDAITGCEVVIDCVDGTKKKIKINPLTYNLQKYRMKGHGMRTMSGRGDMYIYIRHKMPEKLSNEDIKLLNKLKKSENFK